MKKVNVLPPVLLAIALTALFAVSVFNLAGVRTARAYEEYDEPTKTYLSGYSVYYDIASDRSISVTEDITVSFYGRSGFVKYIPVNAGEQVKNIRICEVVEGNLKDVYYDVIYEEELLFLDVGDYSVKYNEHTYRISYDYCLTSAQEGKNLLALTPVGTDWPCDIENVSIVMKLPDGYVSGSALGFVNVNGRRTDIPYEESVSSDGRTTVRAFIEKVEKGSEVRLDLSFEDGALSTYFDATPFLSLIPAFIILGVMVLLKLFVFNKNYLTPVVNYEAPNKMDPLIMGKLIDNKVNGEDVTSLIFYWASKGYLKINLENKNNPTLIRITQALPDDSPDYERLMYARLFKNGDSVKISELTNSFYTTVEQVTSIVNKRTQNLYDKKSIAVSNVIAVLAGLLLVLTPLILAFVNVSNRLGIYPVFMFIIPVVLIYVASVSLAYYRLKLNRSAFILICVGIGALCALSAAVYVIFVPSFIMGLGAKIALSVICFPICACAVILMNRTKEYTEKLNDIIGFKNFILLAEKEQLEMMLEDDPQFYYHVLPYAQVLGVTDKWEDKFKSITVQPPSWATGDVFTTYLEFRIMNNILKSSVNKIYSGMTSRPSSSGRSGGSHGGSFGGFSGGGHGGGGGHFR